MSRFLKFAFQERKRRRIWHVGLQSLPEKPPLLFSNCKFNQGSWSRRNVQTVMRTLTIDANCAWVLALQLAIFNCRQASEKLGRKRSSSGGLLESKREASRPTSSLPFARFESASFMPAKLSTRNRYRDLTRLFSMCKSVILRLQLGVCCVAVRVSQSACMSCGFVCSAAALLCSARPTVPRPLAPSSSRSRSRAPVRSHSHRRSRGGLHMQHNTRARGT